MISENGETSNYAPKGDLFEKVFPYIHTSEQFYFGNNHLSLRKYAGKLSNDKKTHWNI